MRKIYNVLFWVFNKKTAGVSLISIIFPINIHHLKADIMDNLMVYVFLSQFCYLQNPICLKSGCQKFWLFFVLNINIHFALYWMLFALVFYNVYRCNVQSLPILMMSKFYHIGEHEPHKAALKKKCIPKTFFCPRYACGRYSTIPYPSRCVCRSIGLYSGTYICT